MSNQLNYQQAFDLAVYGKKVKRASWPAGQYLIARGGRLILETGADKDEKAEPNYYRQEPTKDGKPNEDKSARDWVVYEDEIASPENPAAPTDSLKANYKNNTKPSK